MLAINLSIDIALSDLLKGLDADTSELLEAMAADSRELASRDELEGEITKELLRCALKVREIEARMSLRAV